MLKKKKAASGGVVSSIADAFFNAYPNGLAQWVRLSGIDQTRVRLIDRNEFEKVEGDSIYIPSFANEVFGSTEADDVRPILAIGLPCQIQGLRLLEKHNRALSKRIICRISLFCGLSISTNALSFLLARAGYVIEDVDHTRFRTKNGLSFSLKNNKKIICNKNSVNYSHMVRRCALCPDHTGELSDISCGDVWLSAFSRKAESPWSVIITRSDTGTGWVRRAAAKKRLWAMRADAEDVISSQRPMLFFKKQTLGQRYLVNRMLGGVNPEYSGPELKKTASLRILLGNLVLLTHLRLKARKSYMTVLTRFVGLSMFNRFIKLCLYLDVRFFLGSLMGYARLIRLRAKLLPHQIRWYRKIKRKINDSRPLALDMGKVSELRFSNEILVEWRRRFPEHANIIILHADKYAEGTYEVFDIANDRNEYDWRRSPETGAKYPNMTEPILGFWFRKSRRYEDFGDEKYAVELHKHYVFVELALAFRLTGNKDYAEVLGQALKSWRASALPHMGIAWWGNIHVAQRMVAWLTTYLLLQGISPETDDICTEIAKGLHEHSAVLSARYMFPANNHKLGALCVLVIDRLYHGKWRGRRLMSYLEALSFELDRQIAPNGSPREGSIAYGYLVLEFLIVLKFLAGCSGFELPDIIVSRSRDMVQWFTDLCGPESQPPAIGDNSGERAFPFSEALWSFADTLALGQQIFDLSVTRRSGPLSWLLLRSAGIVDPAPIQSEIKRESRFIDRDNGYARLTRSGKMGIWSVWMRAGHFGLPPKFGHTHGDFLAPVINLDGSPVLTECGTYKYNVHTERRLKDVLSQGHSGMRYDLFEQGFWRGTFDWKRNGITAGWNHVQDGLSAWMKLQNLTQLTRALRLDDDGLIIEDELRKYGAAERMLEWSFIFDGILLENNLGRAGTAILQMRNTPNRLIRFAQDKVPFNEFEVRSVPISTRYGECHEGLQLIIRRLVNRSDSWSTRISVPAN